MCSRFTAAGQEEIRLYVKRLTGVDIFEDWNPFRNIPPTSRVPVVIQNQTRAGKLMQWGTESPMGFLVNARSETIAEKKLWKSAAERHRCLMFADGFFEWETAGKAKIGHYFSLKDRPAFCMAGLWLPETDKQPDRCVMVTNAPNALVRPFHDRMPSILDTGAALAWLGDQPLPCGRINELCQPYPPERMNQWRVTPKMNRNDYQEADVFKPYQAEPELFG